MSKKYRNIKTVPLVSESDKIMHHCNVSAFQEKNTLLAPLSPMPFAAINTLTAKAIKYLNLGRNGDHAAVITFHETMNLLADGHYANGEYYEDVANETDNPALFALFGYRSYKVKETFVKLPLTITNTSVSGVLYFVIKSKFGTSRYRVEATKITETGFDPPVEFEPLTLSTGTVAGFEPGAKYLIRVVAVSRNGTVGEWTDYVEIRVN